ncbi:MAG: acyltransferase [Gammaproteobacteria bacterium]|nr:acyltransferase [Gammaproteobacteria bacterium]
MEDTLCRMGRLDLGGRATQESKPRSNGWCLQHQRDSISEERNEFGPYWKSEGFIVPLEDERQHNDIRGEGSRSPQFCTYIYSPLDPKYLVDQGIFTKMYQNNFLHSLHWFRGIAIIFVVMGHLPQPSLGNSDLVKIIHDIFTNGTFFFVFIAGYLFWHLIDRYEYKKYLKNKLLFVILPYTVIFTLVIFLVLFLGYFQVNAEFGSVTINLLQPFEPFSGIVWHYMVGISILPPLWFIPFIFIIYIFSFILFRLGRIKYFIYIMLPFLVVSLVTFRPSLEEVSYLYPLYMFVHFIGVFMLGIYAKQKQDFLYKNSRILAVILGLFFAVLIYVRFITTNIEPSLVAFSQIVNIDQLKMLFGVGFFLCLLFFIEQKKLTHQYYIQKLFFTPMSILAMYSFGIFFIHYLFIRLIGRINNLLFGGVDSATNYILFGIVTLLVSLITIMAAHKILGRKSRYFVGS